VLALRLRWLWLQKTEPDKPWEFLPIKAPPEVNAFFSEVVVSLVGNGKTLASGLTHDCLVGVLNTLCCTYLMMWLQEQKEEQFFML